MLNDLPGRLKDWGIRKIFIVTSDHAKDGEVIHAAYRMYADFGAEVELTVPDYHAPGEAKIVYGLDNPEFYAGQAPEPHSDTGLAITGAKHEPETEGTAGLVWESRPEGIAGLADRLDRARRDGARMAVPSQPSDISNAQGVASKAQGFVHCRQSTDYYAPGSPQVWWSCSVVRTPGEPA